MSIPNLHKPDWSGKDYMSNLESAIEKRNSWNNEPKKTVLVFGITRSGLTATMQMLHAGGYPCLGTYPDFEVYHAEKIPFEKHLGMAIKVVDGHRKLPPPGDYHVIRPNRNKTQQAKSLFKFLNHLQFPKGCSNRQAARKLEASLEPDYRKIDEWVKQQTAHIQIEFEDIINTPMRTAQTLAEFVGQPLDLQKMVDVIMIRSTDCHKDMLEFTAMKEILKRNK